MSRTVTTSGSMEKSPTGYSSTYSSYASISSSYPISNGYANSSSTSYCYMTCNTGRNASSYLSYVFSISGIPSGSRITSVTCKAKARVSNTRYFQSATQQLYYYGTAKGSPVSILSTTASERDITDCGTWTYDEIFNVMIRFTGTRGTSNTTSAAYLRIYGTTLTIGYEHDDIYYEITASSSMQGVSILPATQEVLAGGSATLSIDAGSGYVLKDNDVDVTSSVSGSGSAYTYTIVSVGEDHAVIVTSAGDKVFVKVNGSWVEASNVMLKSGGAWKSLSSVFKKENGSWVEKDKSAIFDPDGLYVKS